MPLFVVSQRRLIHASNRCEHEQKGRERLWANKRTSKRFKKKQTETKRTEPINQPMVDNTAILLTRFAAFHFSNRKNRMHYNHYSMFHSIRILQ